MRGRPKKPKAPTLGLTELLTRDRLITPEELANALNVAKVTIYSWCQGKTIPYILIKGSIRFVADDLIAYLAAKRVECRANVSSPVRTPAPPRLPLKG